LAMGRTQQHQELNQALGTRKVISQAIGIVMKRFGLDEDRAFQFLVRVSRNGNIKLRDIAYDLVAEHNSSRTPRAPGVTGAKAQPGSRTRRSTGQPGPTIGP
jgi:hypothetical protein